MSTAAALRPLLQVVELIDLAVSQCPASQCEVVYSAVTRLVRGLLQAQPRNPWLGPLLEELRGQVAATVEQLVTDRAGDKSKVGSSVVCFRLSCHTVT